MRKILCWCPLIGPVVEASCLLDDTPNYLSDTNHPTRFTLSALYHAAFWCAALSGLVFYFAR